MINSSWLNNLRHNLQEINICTSSAVVLPTPTTATYSLITKLLHLLRTSTATDKSTSSNRIFRVSTLPNHQFPLSRLARGISEFEYEACPESKDTSRVGR